MKPTTKRRYGDYRRNVAATMQFTVREKPSTLKTNAAFDGGISSDEE
jgi:hypothetical protein